MEQTSETWVTAPDRLVSATRRDACVVHIYPTGPGMGTRYPLGDTPVVLGRGNDCDIRINDHSVSRRHARIQPGADGFYLVVKSKAGLGKPAPKSGDPPQVRVEVDTRPPTASLYAPQPDSARHDGLVLIWKAEDRNLAANPITLEWAAQRDGRWELIGEPHLPNTGRYTWQVPDNIPPKVYLRLTVRDTAGNSAVAQTPEPILIDLTVPEITNVGLSAR